MTGASAEEGFLEATTQIELGMQFFSFNRGFSQKASIVPADDGK